MEKYNEILDKFYHPKETDPDFKYYAGTKKIIVSAPHSVEQFREGRMKYSEPHTGLLAYLLWEECGCHCIYKMGTKKEDANYDLESTFRDKMLEVIRENKIAYVIDLHQLSPKREVLVNIGTGCGRNLFGKEEMVSHIKELCENKKLAPVWIDEPFSAEEPFTVPATMAQKAGTVSVMFELNSRLFETKEGIRKVFDMLKEVINIIEQEG